MKASSALRPVSHDRVLSALQRYADNPSGFLALNSGNEYFTCPGIDGFISFRRHGRRWIQFAGPFAAPEDRRDLESRFIAGARSAGCRIVAAQLQRPDAHLFSELGLTVNQVGASYAVELAGFSLGGKRFVRLRNKISRALRAGLEVEQADAAEIAAEIEFIDARWLRQKGRHTKELSFLIGEIGGRWQPLRKLFVGRIAGRPIGYISYVPVYGSRPGWMHDLSRRLPDCPPGIMEAINSFAIDHIRSLGAPWLHFGFTPFTGLDDGNRLPTASRAAGRITRLLADHGERLYPARSQLEYKLKWCPSLILPEFFAFAGGISPRSLWSLARVTNIV
jgi:lysylphosphatidylglycerol synthetase-like protein (DUF2156 family)